MRAEWDTKASQRSASEQIWVLKLAKDAVTAGYVFSSSPDTVEPNLNVDGTHPCCGSAAGLAAVWTALTCNDCLVASINQPTTINSAISDFAAVVSSKSFR